MNINNKMAFAKTERWIGLANVQPDQGNNLLGSAKGAMVTVIGDAIDSIAFLALVERVFRDLQFDVLALEDVEHLTVRLMRNKLPENLLRAVDSISSESPLAMGALHSYLANEDDG